jgi:hypothetical protein
LKIKTLQDEVLKVEGYQCSQSKRMQRKIAQVAKKNSKSSKEMNAFFCGENPKKCFRRTLKIYYNISLSGRIP